MLSRFQTTQCEINTQFEVCYCSDLTLTADKHLLNNETEMCVGPTADSPLRTGRLLLILKLMIDLMCYPSMTVYPLELLQ